MNSDYTSCYIYINNSNGEIYAHKDYDISECINKAIEQTNNNYKRVNYIVHCDENWIDYLIDFYKAKLI